MFSELYLMTGMLDDMTPCVYCKSERRAHSLVH